ncbi:hypothetical protein DAPPUDRAFT_301873 [Daphnia pulex]|uniref:BtpA family membrane complex biogenesis protein n=1 Tax=Daphnia pulex TaxID=6669 RepID=E9GB04_DAPPU|nr:hypothetical protein DAPPUDRAFT_301873 [Daphnia pulex]|eukprot:EFX83456.1 hypothetical protein DAPPUDRAFT_301873 [Daphnia pulex]
MERFCQLFKHPACNIIGMIHLRALPGTPKSTLNIEAISEIACKEAELYLRHNLDGVIIENMHDIPYIKGPVGPEIIAAMTRICSDVKHMLPNIPCGLQVLAAGNKEAVAIGHASGFDFIRCEGFVFGHVADEGYIDSCAGQLLRFRKQIGADKIQIYCDIKKKHSSHAITNDVSLAETAKAAEFFMADGVIVTGQATGDPALPSDFKEVANSVEIPIMAGSGVTSSNLSTYAGAHALIIGSDFKRHGRWDHDIDVNRVKQLMETVDRIRDKQFKFN